jgi:hypothetical protein
MGNFIDLAAVLAPAESVRSVLKTLGSEAGCCSVLPDRTLVFCDEDTGNFDRMKTLSQRLGTAVFACHIHDDDLWLYEFYVAGQLTNKFNTIPSYWKRLTPEQESEWRGDADLLAHHWPGLSADSVRRYLHHQSDGPNTFSGKAYPDDEFEYGDCWQLADFLRKLGTPYPESPDNA